MTNIFRVLLELRYLKQMVIFVLQWIFYNKIEKFKLGYLLESEIYVELSWIT